MRFAGFLIVVGLFLAACGGIGAQAPIGPGPTTPPPDAVAIEVVEPESSLIGLTATRIMSGPNELTQATSPLGDERVFAVEKRGRILVLRDGEVLDQPFLDIQADVRSEWNEQGLLTLAFHPNFHNNGRVFVTYTDHDGDLQLVEFRVSGEDPDRLDADSARTVLTVPQPHQYHQSGSIVFGSDGYMWMSLGDGGGQQDRFQNGQNPNTIPGTIIRIDVDAAEPYAIPPDNPFIDADIRARREVWAYGLRNPWRLAMDPMTDLLYIPDVGQEGAEELDVVPSSVGGYNFGWPITEGSECTEDEPCDPVEFELPVFDYPHERSCAIVGGPVYRGATIPELHGAYFYADFCVGWIRSLRYDPVAGVSELQDWEPDLGRLGLVTSLGTDGQGEILVSNLDGEVWRLDAVREDPTATGQDEEA